MKKLESHLLQLEEIHDEAGELNKKNINIADNHNAITTKDKLVVSCQTIGNLPYNPKLWIIKNCITKKGGKQQNS